MNHDRKPALAQAEIRRVRPGLETSDPEEFEDSVRVLLCDWAWDEDASPWRSQPDSPCIEDGVHNCDDWGTGEGRYHGRI